MDRLPSIELGDTSGVNPPSPSFQSSGHARIPQAAAAARTTDRQPQALQLLNPNHVQPLAGRNFNQNYLEPPILYARYRRTVRQWIKRHGISILALSMLGESIVWTMLSLKYSWDSPPEPLVKKQLEIG